MKWEVNLKFCMSVILILGKSSLSSKCGTKLEKGTIMCYLSPVRDDYLFDIKLCTHGIMYAPLDCAEDKCTFHHWSVFEETAHWATQQIQVGMLFKIETVEEKFFGSELLRNNTVNEVVRYIENKGFSFVAIIDITSSKRNGTLREQQYFNFVEDLAEKLHTRGLHIGANMGHNRSELIIPNDVQKMSAVVDWYYFYTYGVAFNGFMEPMTPLTTSNHSYYSRSTTKYWIEKLVEFVKPECLVFMLGPFYHKDTAKSSAVEPGPGSTARETENLEYEEYKLCRNLYLGSGCRGYWDEESSTPWAVCGDDYYTYDDARSIQLKADLLQKYNITGLMLDTGEINPQNVCEKGDPEKILRAVQGFRQK